MIHAHKLFYKHVYNNFLPGTFNEKLLIEIESEVYVSLSYVKL